MEKARRVSVWIGAFSDIDDLMTYMESTYDASDNASSPFRDDTGIRWFDDDFREAAILRPDLGLLANLARFSWSDSFQVLLAETLEKVGASEHNGLILLYNFEYQENPSKRDQGRVKFVGVFDFRD